MEYRLDDPPFGYIDFEQMNLKQAQEYFDWYISIIPERISLLQELINYVCGEKSFVLDFSEESLIKIWEFYLDNAETYEKSKKELREEKMNTHPFGLSEIRERDITLGWKIVRFDIAIYFSECLIRNNKNLKRDFIKKPKNHIDFNRPVVLSIKTSLSYNTQAILETISMQVIDKNGKKESLLKSYKNFMKYTL